MATARALSFALVGFVSASLACSDAPTPAPEPGPAEPPQHEPAVATAIERGHDLFFGKAMCSTCHRVDDEGTMIVGPNLGVDPDQGMDTPLAERIAARGTALAPAVYVINSILDPDAFVVPGYARGVMKSPDDIPVELTADELVALVAFALSIHATSPIDPASLELARTNIPTARAARAHRRAAATQPAQP